jgi:hypothetical protein
VKARPEPYRGHTPDRDPRLVFGPDGVGEGGAMPFDYSRAPGYAPSPSPAPLPAGPEGPLRLVPAPRPDTSPGRLAPAPPPYTSPRPPVELTPAPPRYVSPEPARSTYVNPWEVLGSGVADEFFTARLNGFTGSWQDWLDER